MKNKLIKIGCCLMMLVVVVNVVFATTGLSPNVSMPSDSDEGDVNNITSAETAITKVWGSVKLILQIVALATILGCGVRYMFASADQKADIKKSLTVLVLGAAIVFGTTLVIDFIQEIASDVLVVRD